jgi:hypothetical protein
MDDPRPVEFSEFEDLLDREKFTGAVLYLWVFQILRKVEKTSLAMLVLLNLIRVAASVAIAVTHLIEFQKIKI